ncbi:MAG: glycosyltransferase [Bacteroidales bacterium]|jgi:glycosyltransferase involved in cell wall biosynthesis|nr:glycosyltransferase [Bacteroidales bacterium]
MGDNKQRIIIIGPAYPYRGGQALVEAYLHQTLTQLGYDTNTLSYTLLYPSVFFPGTTQYDKSAIVPFEHANKIRRVLNSVNPISWIKTFKIIKKEQPDGVLFVWWMPFFGPALGFIAKKISKKLKSTKIIFLVENYISHENRWFDKFFTRKTLCYADAFICESAYIKKQIEIDFPKLPIFSTTLSIYDCYNLNRFTNLSAKQHLDIKTENVVLFFGLIRPYKGLDRLIETFAHLLKKIPDTTLLVVGENYEDMEKYQKIIQHFELEKKVILVNKFIDNENVEPYFKASDVVVLPYYSGTQSGILMMAYGFQIPVVVTDVGGIAELVEPQKTGIVVPNNEVAHLLPAIEQIITTKKSIDYANEISQYTHNLGYSNLGNMLQKILKKDE